MKKFVVPGLIVAALVAGAPYAVAQTTTPTPKPAPSVAQLCAATGDAALDALLDGVARAALVGDLAPLLDLTVPTSDTAVLAGAVQLSDVRKALNCAPVTLTPTATPTASPTGTPSPTATTTPDPTTTAPPTTRPRPRGGVDTGA